MQPLKIQNKSSNLNQWETFIFWKYMYSLMLPDSVIKELGIKQTSCLHDIVISHIQITKTKPNFEKSWNKQVLTVSSEHLLVWGRLYLDESGSLSFSKILLIIVNFNNDWSKILSFQDFFHQILLKIGYYLWLKITSFLRFFSPYIWYIRFCAYILFIVCIYTYTYYIIHTYIYYLCCIT